MTEREKELQTAVDTFLAPIYARVGRLIEEQPDRSLADLLDAYGVEMTCADLHQLYRATEQELAQ
jgi:hypothetical protein